LTGNIFIHDGRHLTNQEQFSTLLVVYLLIVKIINAMKVKEKKAGKTPARASEKAARNARASKRPDYPHETELDIDNEGEGSPTYSEEHDVTPPIAHEFPSFGNTETDFVSPSRHGRKTGRLLDHEPGL
jgi:hypothetical protein